MFARSTNDDFVLHRIALSLAHETKLVEQKANAHNWRMPAFPLRYMGMISPLLAILLAVLASTVIGALWYAPFLFGNAWRAGLKLSEPKTPEEKARMMRGVIGNMLATFLTMIGLVAAIELLKPANSCPLMLGIDCTAPPVGALQGMLLGAGAWLFFLVPTVLQEIFFEQKNVKASSVTLAYRLVELIVAGAILGALV